MTDPSVVTPDPYDLPAMRHLLRTSVTDTDLRRFCQDRVQFRFLYSYFGAKFSLDDLIDVVLDQCRARGLLPDLLVEIQAYKPTGSRLAPGVPFQAPPLPAHFIPRPEVSSDLQAHLLAQETTAPGTLVVSAVHGLGGIGKTTLVAELSRRRELRSRFPDGLLWATLGQGPQVLSQLHEWIQSLGDRDFHPTTVEGASAHLRTLLYDKACLLVLDDAWQADHVRPFLVGGEICRVLITTRDATLARKVGARLYDLDVMTEAQSLALFEARLGSLDGQRGQAADLARELGYLPLALELAAAQLEEGLSWTELLEAFRQGLAALELLDLEEAAFRNESLRLSFRLSLDQLTPEEQEAFAWLGLLAEDALLNVGMAATLWSLPEASARKRLHRFRNKALLRQAGEEWYGIHDLLRDEARLRLVEQMPLPQAHAAYVEHYRTGTRQGQWHTVPDDGYIHEHLVWHMEQAGQLDQIHALLAEQTLEHRCGWYEVRERLGQTAGYLADVAQAWRLAEAGSEGLGIGRQCRYALITASLNSVAANMPADLLELLAKRRTWPPLRCLAYANQKPDLEERASTLARLVPYLPKETAKGVLRQILSMKPLGVFEAMETRPIGFVLTPEVFRSIVEAMVPLDDESGLQMAFALALTFEGKGCVYALSQIARTWRALGKIEEASRTLRKAWDLIQELDSDYEYALTITDFVPALPEPERAPTVQFALDRARGLQSRHWRAMALAGLAPYLPEPEQLQAYREALAEMSRPTDNPVFIEQRAALLAQQAGALPEALLIEAIGIAKGLPALQERARALAYLAGRLAVLGRLGEALELAQTLEEPAAQARVLTHVAANLPNGIRTAVVQAALDTARHIDEPRLRAEILVELFPQLSEGQQQEALLKVRAAITGETSGAGERGAPGGWAEYVRGLGLTWLLQISRHVPPATSEDLLQEVLAATQGIGDEQHLAGLQEQLVTLRSGQQRRSDLHGPVGATLPMPEEPARWDDEPPLIPLIPLQDREQAMKARALLEGFAAQPENLREEVLKQVLATPWPPDLQTERAEELLKLLPVIAVPLQGLVLQEAVAACIAAHEALSWFQASEWPGLVREARLVQRLAELGNHSQALAVARASPWAQLRSGMLAELVPILPPGLQEQAAQEALDLALALYWAQDRLSAVARLAPSLEGLPLPALRRLWQRALWSLATHTRQELLEHLGALAPVLAELGGLAALDEAASALEDVGRWWP